MTISSKFLFAGTTIACVSAMLVSACAVAQSSKPTAKAKPTACHLLTNAEVSSTIGRPVLKSTDMSIGSDMANCTYYSDAAGVIPVASVQINLRGGASFYKAACEAEPKASGKPRPALSGLGDQACVDNTPAGSGIFIRKGDKLATVSTGVVVGKANYDQTLAFAKAVAAKF